MLVNSGVVLLVDAIKEADNSSVDSLNIILQKETNHVAASAGLQLFKRSLIYLRIF